MATIEIKNINRTYKMGSQEINALKNVSLTIESGKLVVILGPSGSGKTTLLNVLGGIDKLTKGKILFDGVDITKFSRKQLSEYRRKKVGFIFQFFNLLPIYNAIENVQYAVEISLNKDKKMSSKEIRDKAVQYLDAVDMGDKLDLFPSKLSGGEQQRVAAARAFSKEPDLLLCDEPTGELSAEEGRKVLAVIQKLSQEIDTLVVLVTHNQEIAKIADIVIKLKSGEINEIIEHTPAKAEELNW